MVMVRLVLLYLNFSFDEIKLRDRAKKYASAGIAVKIYRSTLTAW
ncbi:MAG: hypothetical protein Kow0019_16110 [Methanobacteriaceae archaeon]